MLISLAICLKRDRGNIAARVIGNGRRAAIWMAKLHMGTALADAGKTVFYQKSDDLSGLEDG